MQFKSKNDVLIREAEDRVRELKTQRIAEFRAFAADKVAEGWQFRTYSFDYGYGTGGCTNLYVFAPYIDLTILDSSAGKGECPEYDEFKHWFKSLDDEDFIILECDSDEISPARC